MTQAQLPDRFPSEAPSGSPIDDMAWLAEREGLRRVDIVAWRDLDHPEAGGSELHAARIAERWAAAGIDVELIASRAPGGERRSERDGYVVHRQAGRYGIFPRVGAGRLLSVGGAQRPDATVEVWNGMPFFSPLWSRSRRMVFLHHVHGAMWDLVLPPALARAGRLLESRLAPPFYRNTPVVTLSSSSRRAIVEGLRLDPNLVSVVEPGVDPMFRPGPRHDSEPLVVAVGRLVPYKRFDMLIDVLASLKGRHRALRAVIAGEGTERPLLEARIAAHGAGDWLTLPGRVGDDELVRLYQRAWVVASASAFEGWGLTITEAAACATPAVASDIDGHRDAIHNGVSGFLAEPGEAMADRIDMLLSDPLLRRRMQKAALARASQLTWDETARRTLGVLASTPCN